MTDHHLTRRALMAAAAPTGALLVAGGADAATPTTGPEPQDLRVEWLSEPLGLETLRPRFTWKLGSGPNPRRAERQAGYRVVVATTRAAAKAGQGDVWDSGRMEGGHFAARPPRPLNLLSQAEYFWSVQVWDGGGASFTSRPARFVTGVLGARGWTGSWIAAEPDRPVHVARMLDQADRTTGSVLPVFRKDLALRGKVRRAIVSVCGLGHHELSINGQPVGAEVLSPGWTDYRKSVLYNTYDVTDLLDRGPNVLGVMLGNGMYNVEGVKGRYTKLVGTFGQPKLILQLRITHADGREEIVVSDGSWLTRPGPITFSSIYAGEDYDARGLAPDWNRPGPAGAGWSPALTVRGPGGRLRPQAIPPVTVDRAYAPLKVTEPCPGIFVYDFGMNASSRPAMVVRGPAGARISLRPAETLDPATGLVDQKSIGARPNMPVVYHYTLAGRGDEAWKARFSYCGCRYMQVEGAAPPGRATPGQAQVLSLKSDFIHADVAQVGRFESTDGLLVGIHDLIKQAVLSNTVSVLTDCPHREKLGWLEQTHLNADTAFFVEDAITLYEKLAVDISEAQLPNGEIPEIAPEYVQFVNKDGSDTIFRDSPEWGAAVVLSSWAAYRFSGDPTALATGWRSMVGYTDYLETRRKDGLISYGLGDWLDIGPKKNVGVSQLTSLGLTSTATYFQMLSSMSRIAEVLGRPEDARAYAARAEGVRRDFNRRLFKPATNTYDTGSQTAQAMPLALGMVPQGRERAVLDLLVADISSRSDHVTAGDVGFHYVVQALMEHGRPDVLLRMLRRTDSPSYGAQLKAGATALTENWDPSDGGSQNHFMLGHAMSWLYRGLLGIDIDFARTDGPAIQIAPQILASVGQVSGGYDSVLGRIGSAWSVSGDRAELQVDVPAGAVARVLLPRAPAAVSAARARLAIGGGVLDVRPDRTGTAVTVGSGIYQFGFPVGRARASQG